MTDDPMTSAFAYLDFFDRPKDREKLGYLATWYSKEVHPADSYDARSAMGNGWWRYSKLYPYGSVSGPEDITFPTGDLHMPQIAWREMI